MALLRCYGSPGCSDSGLQLFGIVGSGISHLTLHNTSLVLTRLSWSLNQVLVALALLAQVPLENEIRISIKLDMGFNCRIPCVKPVLNNSVRSVSPGLKTKRTALLLSGPKLCSLMKVNLAFPLEIRVPKSGGREERHTMRQFDRDADFIFQQDLAPAHSAKATSTWFKDLVSLFLIGQQTRLTLTPLKIYGVLWSKMRYARPNNAEQLKATIRATWASKTPQQCHRLIDSMPRCINSGKRSPN